MPLIMGIAISLRKKFILSNINFTFFHYPKNFKLRRTGAYPKKAIISPIINNVSHVMLFLEKMQTMIDNSNKPVPVKQHINCNISSHLFLGIRLLTFLCYSPILVLQALACQVQRKEASLWLHIE